MTQIKRTQKNPATIRPAPLRPRRTPKHSPVEADQDREVIEITQKFIQENERVLRELGN